jgi:hypothetical protein
MHAEWERSMARCACVLIVVLGVISSAALSQGVDGRGAAEQRKRLIEQKLRLVESLVSSPAAQASVNAHEPESSALVLEGRRLLDRVREALAGGQLDEASTLVDDALRNATRASARLSGKPGALSNSVQQSNNKNLSEQVASYRSGIEDLAKQGNSEAKSAVARIDSLQTEAATLVQAGKLGDANRKLADAYRLAVESISKLRAGQTVTLSLKFNSSSEEYDYERRRFQSNEILVDMMIGEGRNGAERRDLVDGFVRDGKRLLGLAADKARGGDYESAVAEMEKANAQLNRALQTMGVPVF